MDERVTAAFAGSGRRRLEEGLELRAATAFAVLQARREAAVRSQNEPETLGLWMNACVLARAVFRDGIPAFENGEALLQAVPLETLTRWAEAYAALCREENPVCSAQSAEKAAEALAQEPYERLKWRVLRAFGALPSEARARKMLDRDYLYCAAQMMLDEQEKLDAMCPACRERARRALCPVCGAEMGEQNAEFDEKRFEELRDAGIREETSFGADKACGAV